MPKLLAFSGAGISAESNIPTFQDIPGIRDKLTRSFATNNPQAYSAVIEEMRSYIDKAEPNAAHYALAQYQVPVITMNIDGLHQRAGSNKVIAVHGDLANIVLYGDLAPAYATAYQQVEQLEAGDTLLVIGASLATQFSYELRLLAQSKGARVVEIQEQAASLVPEFLQTYFQENE